MANHKQDTKTSAVLRTLAIPELFALVCGFLDKNDYAACLRVSRRTFASVAPIVWEEVDLKSVLFLIPGVQVTTDPHCIWKFEPHLVFEPPVAVDLARFEVYRFFVKSISTAAPYAITFPEEWPGVGPQAPLHPLLPNLRSITINTFGWIDDCYTDWVPRLLTPDLKALKLSSIPLMESSGYDVRNHENAWINLSRCIELVDAISRTCPAIETLDMFAHEENDYQDRTEYAIACEKVAHLQNLRSLSFGGASAGETLFRAFSLLPHLESLSLVSDRSQTLPNAHSLEVMLSDNSFPALRNLTLCGLNPKIIERIYNSPQLFCRLYCAKIVFEAEDYQGCKSDNLHSAYAMKCFRHGCPHLTDLTILTRGDGGFFCLFRWFIPIFEQLPLRRLELGRVYLNPMLGYHSTEDEREELEAGLEENSPGVTWEEFLGVLPHIEELILGNSFTSHDLPVFAKLLPKLCFFSPRNLGFKDSWEETFQIVTGSTATQSIVMCAREYPQLYARAFENISYLASQIHSIWPNVEFKAFNNKEKGKLMTSRLNEAIQVLRQT